MTKTNSQHHYLPYPLQLLAIHDLIQYFISYLCLAMFLFIICSLYKSVCLLLREVIISVVFIFIHVVYLFLMIIVMLFMIVCVICVIFVIFVTCDVYFYPYCTSTLNAYFEANLHVLETPQSFSNFSTHHVNKSLTSENFS